MIEGPEQSGPFFVHIPSVRFRSPDMNQPAIPLVIAAALLGACATSAPADALLGRGQFKQADGASAGTVELFQRDGRVFLRLSLSGLEPGTRALHLHQQGKCDAPDFMSSGGHLNPFGKSHGRLSETGQHLGDLPNIEVTPSGKLEVELDIETASSSLVPHVFDADGTSVMIHAGADDYRTDPTGGAGARIACAVLSQPT